MRRNTNSCGFTLVEIMIVITIITLLATIATPNLLRARLNTNDVLARATIRTLSTAAESYATTNNGNYPLNISSLTGVTPAYISTSYCDSTISGYFYTCTFNIATYLFSSMPVTVGKTGTTTVTISTGGILIP